MARIEPLDLREARTELANRNAEAAEKRSLTEASTLAQLGGTSGWGGFNGAKLNRMQNDWPSASRSADQDLITDLRRLRARARNQAINSPTATKFLQMVRMNVVGPHGVKLAFKVPRQRKTKTSALDDATNLELRRGWEEWGKKGSCTVCGRYSLRELDRLFVENVARDGEQLIRMVYFDGRKPGAINPFGFALQLIDADQLDDSYTQMAAANGVQIRMGVEVNQYQRPLAYHIFDGNPYEVSFSSANRVRVPADQIVHWFIAHRTGQSRGYPWFAATMSQLNMLDGYFSAELAAARIGSSVVMSIESAADDGDDGLSGDGTNADGTKAVDIGTGMALELGAGQKLEDHTPSHPTNAFEPFIKQSGRVIASGMNVAYHKLCNDLAGVNYSSGRLGELEERDYWMEIQTSMIDNVKEPIYERWLSSALLNRALDLPLADRKKFSGPSLKWEPRRWPWVDPLKDVQASTLLVQNGFETHESILNSQGRDLAETYAQLKVEQDLADELGLALGTDIRGQGTSEINNEDETPESGGEGEEKPAAQENEKPAKPKARPTPAPAKPKVKRGMHPANAESWDLTRDED
jgi:lambda family phage portal protein